MYIQVGKTIYFKTGENTLLKCFVDVNKPNAKGTVKVLNDFHYKELSQQLSRTIRSN